MLSATESASLMGVSPARVRELIAEGTLPAQKIGRAWALREEDVLQRIAKRPAPGRPASRIAAHRAESDDPVERKDLHELYIACKTAFSSRLDAATLMHADADESGFYMAVADHFLRQRQRELIKQGVY